MIDVFNRFISYDTPSHFLISSFNDGIVQFKKYNSDHLDELNKLYPYHFTRIKIHSLYHELSLTYKLQEYDYDYKYDFMDDTSTSKFERFGQLQEDINDGGIYEFIHIGGRYEQVNELLKNILNNKGFSVKFDPYDNKNNYQLICDDLNSNNLQFSEILGPISSLQDTQPQNKISVSITISNDYCVPYVCVDLLCSEKHDWTEVIKNYPGLIIYSDHYQYEKEYHMDDIFKKIYHRHYQEEQEISLGHFMEGQIYSNFEGNISLQTINGNDIIVISREVIHYKEVVKRNFKYELYSGDC